MAESSVRWSGTRTQMQARSASGHEFVMDEGEGLGDDLGMRPTEALLSALGGCIGVNAVLLLKKMRQPFEELTIVVTGEQAREWPRNFTAIQVRFEIGWTGPRDEALVDKALDYACNRYCPVDATLTRGTRIEVSRVDRDGAERSPDPPPEG